MSRFRIPDGWRPRMPDLDRLRDREWSGVRPRRPRWLHGPDMDRLRDREWRRPRWLIVPGLRIPSSTCLRTCSCRASPSSLLLFGGGLYFGNMLGLGPERGEPDHDRHAQGQGHVETVKGKR